MSFYKEVTGGEYDEDTAYYLFRLNAQELKDFVHFVWKSDYNLLNKINLVFTWFQIKVVSFVAKEEALVDLELPLETLLMISIEPSKFGKRVALWLALQKNTSHYSR
jgi:hypothetical protein